MRYSISFRFYVIVMLTIIGITAPYKSNSQNKSSDAKKNITHTKENKIVT